MTNHGNTPGRLSRKWATPKVIAHVDLSRMTSATAGANRGGLSALVDYVGGRLHGQTCMAGWCGLFRDEAGRDLDGRIPDRHYRLYVDDVCLHYIHSTLIRDYEDLPTGE